MGLRFLLSLAVISFSSQAFATHTMLCTGQQDGGEFKQVSLSWLMGSLGMVGPVELVLQHSGGQSQTISYTVSSQYEGTRLQKVGYFGDDEEVRLQLMDESFNNTVILFKFDWLANDQERGKGVLTVRDQGHGVEVEALVVKRCEVL